MQQPSGSIWHTINCPCWLLQPSSRSSWPPSRLKETAYAVLRSQQGHHCHVGAWDPGSFCDYKSTLAFPGSRRPGPASSCNSHLGQVQSGEYKLRILSWDNLHSRLQRALRSTQKGAKKKKSYFSGQGLSAGSNWGTWEGYWLLSWGPRSFCTGFSTAMLGSLLGLNWVWELTWNANSGNI